MLRQIPINVAIPRCLLLAAQLAACELVIASSSATAAIEFYRLSKAIVYTQTASNTQPTTPRDTNGFYGGYDLKTTVPADLTSAKAFSATNPLVETMLTEYSPGYWSSVPYYTSLAAMDSALPAGHTYQFNIDGGTLGARSAQLPTPANNLFSPSIPYFVGTTFDQLQDLEPSAPFTVHWNAFATPVGANDAPIFFSITRVSDGQPVIYLDLANAATSYQIGAGVLVLNTEYKAAVNFSSRVFAFDAGFTVGDSLVEFDLTTELQFKTRLPGDYNRNDVVDAADYTLWRNTLGQTNVTPFAGADGDGDGKILAADYAVWVANYGITGPASGSLLPTVPEPAAVVHLLCGLFAAANLPRRDNRSARKQR